MPAKDTFHNQVRDALIEEGWIVTYDPYKLVIGGRNTFIDMAAGLPIAAQKDGREIAVEIKSFLGQSLIDDLEDALGQYGMYHAVLELREPARVLYLALPNSTRAVLLGEKDFRSVLSKFHARLIFYDLLIHRNKRCDLSLFQIGLLWLEHALNEGLTLWVAFRLPPRRQPIFL